MQMEAMQSLFPEMGLGDQLVEGDKGSNTHECPGEGDGQCPFYEAIVPSFEAAHEKGVEIEKVAENKADACQIENGGGEQEGVDPSHNGTQGEIHSQQQPHEGVHEEDHRLAAKNYLQPE